MIKENQILAIAVENLKKQVLKTEVELITQFDRDCDAILCIAGRNFKCEIKQYVKNSGIQTVLNQCHMRGTDLLVTGNISKTTMERLTEEGINVLDASGNCMIEIPNNLVIHISGNKSLKIDEEEGMNFKFPGIKVLFSLLSLKDFQVPSVRELAAMSGASTGTVKHVEDVLQANDYIFTSGKNKFIKDKGRLLDDWVALYNKQQRAGLQIGRASWIKPNKEWQAFELPDGMMWGGDAGAYLMNGYMTPADFCIYSAFPVWEIVKTGSMIPNKDGDVIFYQKFWKEPLTELGKAIICYADLINRNNSRCLEAAKMIRNEKLTYSE